MHAWISCNHRHLHTCCFFELLVQDGYGYFAIAPKPAALALDSTAQSVHYIQASGGRAGGRQALSGQAGACCHSLCPVMRRAGEAARVSRRARAGASQPPDGVALRGVPLRLARSRGRTWHAGQGAGPQQKLLFRSRRAAGGEGRNPRPLVRVRPTPLPPARLLLVWRPPAKPSRAPWSGCAAGRELGVAPWRGWNGSWIDLSMI